MHPGSRLLIGVIGEAGEAEQRDPVVRGVVGQPRPGRVLKGDLGAYDGRVPVDQRL